MSNLLERPHLAVTPHTRSEAMSSLVAYIPHFLRLVETAIIVAQFVFLEWLGLVKLHSVESAHLVSVRVLLSAPEGAVPELSVG